MCSIQPRRLGQDLNKVVVGALFRYARKTMDTEVKKNDSLLGEALKAELSEGPSEEFLKSSIYRACVARGDYLFEK